MQFSSWLPSITVGVSLTIMWQVEVPAMMPSWLATPSPLKLMHSLKVEKIMELFVKIQNICKMCSWIWIAYLMASMPRAPAWASMREAATGMAWLPVLFKFILMASHWSRTPTLWPGFLTWWMGNDGFLMKYFQYSYTRELLSPEVLTRRMGNNQMAGLSTPGP